MRILPHALALMALRGRRTLRGRPLPNPGDAARKLRQLTGQDFGLDADKWAEWIKKNRKGLYERPQPDA